MVACQAVPTIGRGEGTAANANLLDRPLIATAWIHDPSHGKNAKEARSGDVDSVDCMGTGTSTSWTKLETNSSG